MSSTLVYLGPSFNDNEHRFYHGANGINNVRINISEEWKAGQLLLNGLHSLYAQEIEFACDLSVTEF